MAAVKIKAAVFDVDGTLLDSREFVLRAYEYALRKHGHKIPKRALIARQAGLSLVQTYRNLVPKGDFSLLTKAHDEFQADRIDLIEAYEGLHEMLNQISKSGLKLGAFSSRYKNLVVSLKTAGIYNYFAAIVQGDEVVNHKPHPEGLLKIIQKLAVEPEETAMIGDAVFDIEAGKAAGVGLTIALTHGFGAREDLEKAGPDYIVDSLAEIPPILLAN